MKKHKIFIGILVTIIAVTFGVDCFSQMRVGTQVPTTSREANLTNLVYPSQSGYWKDIHKSGWLPTGFNQQWGGAQYGMELVDDATGTLYKFDVATGYIENDTAGLVGYDNTNCYLEQGFKVSENISVQALWIYLYKVANPTDNLQLFIYSDSGGSPNATITNGTATAQAGTLHTSNSVGTWYRFVFATPPSLTANTQYHIVMNRSGSVSSTNYWYVKGMIVGNYPHGAAQKGSNVPAWSAYSSFTDICFLIESTSATQFLQTSGVFDSKLVFTEGTPLNQSKGLTQPLKNFFDHKQGSFMIRGGSFTKDKTIADFQYGLDHDRIVVRCNASTGYAQVDLYESDGTKSTVTGSTDISATGPFDIGIRYRALNDGSDYLTLYINGSSEGTPLTSQSFNFDPLMKELGTAWLGGGFALAPTWTQTLDMSVLPSAASPAWTYSGTANEGDHMVVSGGRLYQAIVGSTDTGAYTKSSLSLNNTNGWAVSWRQSVKKGYDTIASQDAAVSIWDGTKRIHINPHTYWVGVSFDGGSTEKAKIQMDLTQKGYTFLAIGKGSDFILFCNGQLVVDGTGLLTQATATNAITFGDNDSGAGANSEAIWDYVKYYITEAILPQFTSGNISEFGYWTEDMSGIFSALYNAGTRVSIKSYCGVKKNYVEWIRKTNYRKGITFSPSSSSGTFVQLADMELFSIGERYLLAGCHTTTESGGAANGWEAFYMDGSQVHIPNITAIGQYIPDGNYYPKALNGIAEGLFGLHKIETRWYVSSGTYVSYGKTRIMTVQEVE